MNELELLAELSTTRVVGKLMTAALGHTPSGTRGQLLLVDGDGGEARVAAEGAVLPGGAIDVVRREAAAPAAAAEEIPLLHGGRRMGALHLDVKLTAEARAALERLAAHAAIALENARRHEALLRENEQRARAAELVAGEKRLLEMVATGEPLATILDALCRLVETLAPRSLASILLVDAGGRVHHGAAPSLPSSYTSLLEGLRIGPTAASCGTAAYTRKRVIVTDIAVDPLWAREEHRGPALAHGLRACWSTPILARDGSVLGTFAVYYREPAGPTPTDEELVAQLTHLSSIAIERERAERALRLSEAYLNQAQRLAGTGSYSWSPTTGEVKWSEETYRIYGVDPARAPDVELVLRLTHPDDVEAYRAVLARSAKEGEGFDHERRLLLPDGTMKIIHVVAQPVTRDDVGVVMVGAVRDVTTTRLEAERLRSSLEEKDALLKEVHHRVKNNLQLISSLLNLQASRSGDRAVAELLADSRNRVRSMALVHEDLYRAGNFARIAMATHVKTLCAHLGRAYGTQADVVALEARVEPVELEMDLDRAVSIGLIVNELVSNALKHAFPGGRRGRIVVELVRDPDGQHWLAVRDDGIGLPAGVDVRKVESMGLQLVCDLVEQLKGELQVERGGGTRFVIRF